MNGGDQFWTKQTSYKLHVYLMAFMEKVMYSLPRLIEVVYSSGILLSCKEGYLWIKL